MNGAARSSRRFRWGHICGSAEKVRLIRSMNERKLTWSSYGCLTKWNNGLRGLNLYLCKPLTKVLQTPLRHPKSFFIYKTCLKRTHLQVQFSCSQYDMFSSRLLESLYAWISLTEQPHPANELRHIGWCHSLQGNSNNRWSLENGK